MKVKPKRQRAIRKKSWYLTKMHPLTNISESHFLTTCRKTIKYRYYQQFQFESDFTLWVWHRRRPICHKNSYNIIDRCYFDNGKQTYPCSEVSKITWKWKIVKAHDSWHLWKSKTNIHKMNASRVPPNKYPGNGGCKCGWRNGGNTAMGWAVHPWIRWEE